MSARERVAAFLTEYQAEGQFDTVAWTAGHVLTVADLEALLAGAPEQPAEREPFDPAKVPTPRPEYRCQAHASATSWEAALSQTPEGTARMYEAVYRALWRTPGGLTDYELRERFKAEGIRHSWSGVSARRVELVRAGWVRPTGETRPTPNGQAAQVWEAVA